jgi:hypothetical protein
VRSASSGSSSAAWRAGRTPTTRRPGLFDSGGPGPGHHPGPVRARWCKHAVIPRQMGTGFWHQRGEPRDEILGLEDHMRGAVPIRRLQCTAHPPALGQRQPLGGDRRGLETLARQVLELVPLRGLRRNTRVQ